AGQSLFLTGNHELLGNGDVAKAVPLQRLDDSFWHVTIKLPRATAPDANIICNYILRDPDGSLTYDWGRDKMINPASFTSDDILIIDSWNHAGYCENVFYTEPFQQVLLKANQTEVRLASPKIVTHVFKAKAPLLTKGQTLCLLGNTAALGNWNTGQPVLLNRNPGEDFFSTSLDLTGASFPIAYKYCVYDVEHNQFVRYEDGNDRVLRDPVAAGKQTIVNDGFAALPSNTWKGTGVSVPVFSLRSENSFGVGGFSDLKLLVDWCRQTGLKLIQILPVNDTTATHTWLDSYPYAAISAFALHPLYLDPGKVAQGTAKSILQKLEGERKRLNALPALDYEAVTKTKLSFLRRIYPAQKKDTFASPAYRQFFDQNKLWLTPYAVFSHLRDKYGTSDFNQWPAHRRFSAQDAEKLLAKDSPAADDIEFHYFTQYHLHIQLREAMEYAHANGVILKGDIAIGVYRYGADAWQQPGLYRMDFQAGAPPDDFAEKGQNWGFPTYNWQRMKEDGFAWWKQRFEQMGRYFDAFRIDHILGFFRIWSVPMHAVEGIMGYFVPAIPVDIGDFRSRGISFLRSRYVNPYITGPVLRNLFGNDAELVKHQFLNSEGGGNLVLKPEFRTQRQVEHHFAALEPGEQNNRLKQGLYDLISNVILFEVEGSQGRQFHFRFSMDRTSSFANLDPGIQAPLKELYVDYFFRRQDRFWRQEAMQKLPALKRVTNMLVCGEDLGLVPECVPDVMEQLGLLSLEIQRMPKDPKKQFFNPKDAPYLSVVTPATHDMSTVRGWWEEEDKGRIQQFYNHELGQPGDAPRSCEPWISRAIVAQHLNSPAMWSIFQLQDLLGMDENLRWKNPGEERINVPANSKNYWRYRMHLTLEALTQARTFNNGLKTAIEQSGR
ncbi:MAG TPA: 4-alpha-glucanotransferase, partial [Verrucomicrobiae bacterium]|nr:4-alpha-glucanotransferase [Verrucomicrobiae bacterium]